MVAMFRSVEDMVAFVSDGVRPPERLSVSEAAARYRMIYNPGSYTGPWRNDTTPYLVDFMDVLASDAYSSAIFVGPAQCGKSDCAFNWLTYTMICDPVDMIIYDKTRDSARDMAISKLDRLYEHTPALKERLLPGSHGVNTFDRKHRSGAYLFISWPTKNNLSGKSIPRIWLGDYDRMPPDVGGEGSAYMLALKRATTFGSKAMVVAESSPSFPVDMDRYIRKSDHEAPPTQGILGLYNLGDKRRWYWPCQVCGTAFEPSFANMKWDESEDIAKASETARMVCPSCGAEYFDQAVGGMPGKAEMNRLARWVKDGEVWDPKTGEVRGSGASSGIASFWLKGPAATFISFQDIVRAYLSAERAFELSGEENELKAVVNTTLAEPYIPKAERVARTADELASRAADWGEREVPEGVRFLIASIDLQKRGFVVQVHGIGDGSHGYPDVWVIDRFTINKSRRRDSDGDVMLNNLAAYPEDWWVLVDEVILRSYPLADGSGRRMAIKLVVSDSAGKKGFTENAYRFFRWLRDGPGGEWPAEHCDPKTGEPLYTWEPGLTARYHLVRGAAQRDAPRIKLKYPDAQRGSKYSGARGDIPVWYLNTQVLKDTVDAMLARTDPGGRVNFPLWLPKWFYKELTVEVKDPKHGWVNMKGYRNEAWDLLVYCRAALLMPGIDVDNIDWDSPPPWAAEWDENDLVFSPEEEEHPLEMPRRDDEEGSIAALAQKLGGL